MPSNCYKKEQNSSSKKKIIPFSNPINKIKRLKKDLSLANTKINSLKQEIEKYELLNSYIPMIENLSHITHNIRNPLSVAITNLDLILMDKDKLPEDISKSINASYEATEKIKQMIDTLLTYDHSNRKNKETDLVNFMEDYMLNLFEIIFPKNFRIHFYNQTKQNSTIVNIGKSSLEQVILNLTTNAFYASNNNGNLDIRLNLTPPYYMIEFKDYGCGISEKNLDKIFDLKFTTKPKNEGNGIGLHSCKKIIERNNGYINVESQINKGTTFKVYIPYLYEF